MKWFKRLIIYLSQIHIYPLKTLLSLRSIPKYLQDIRVFKANSSKGFDIRYYPCLLDRKEPAAILGEYFWQDLFIAKRIIEDNPQRHIDVGSRVDGFIAHLACVRQVEVFDIRPLTKKIQNVMFRQWDIRNPDQELIGVADCVSCLHTLEHIGLGRYGDPIDQDGWKKGLSSLARLVRPGGGLWLSVPIGMQRVEFNAHRVFAPKTIDDEAKLHQLRLAEFHFWEGEGLYQSNSIESDFRRLARINYALGIFYFRLNSDN
jgi:SAM-dependent methyltransferase